MTIDDNRKHAALLRSLADVYELTTTGIAQNYTGIHTSDKEELLSTIAAIGGKFIKKYDDYYLRLESLRIPGVSVIINRDKVCRKVVTFDCEPLLSPDEENEIDAALITVAAKEEDEPIGNSGGM